MRFARGRPILTSGMRAAAPRIRATLLGALLAAAGGAGAGCHVLIRPDLRHEGRLESPSYTLRSDLSVGAQAAILDEAERMRAALDAALPLEEEAAPGGKEACAPRREIVAFASPSAFRRYLAAHRAPQRGAIGFYCETGGECALVLRDPPAPEDLRVLRHELVHQHLAARLRARPPGWIEEGLAEALAIALALDGGEGAVAEAGALAALALGLAAGREAAPAARAAPASWSSPEARRAPATAIPPPDWGGGEDGYALHLLFVRFLESIGEGRSAGGALGRALAAAARGEEPAIDLGRRFASVADVEAAFHDYILRAAPPGGAREPDGGGAEEGAGAP